MPWVYEGQRVILASSSGELDRSKVASVTLSMTQPNVAQSILLERFGVQAGDALQTAVYANLVDAYGQSTRGKWPEKIVTDEQLKTSASKEQLQLKNWLADLPKRDQFGGWLDGPRFEAMGFFRTEKRDGRWYLVTPDGHAFFSLGYSMYTLSGEPLPQASPWKEHVLLWPPDSKPQPDLFHSPANGRV